MIKIILPCCIAAASVLNTFAAHNAPEAGVMLGKAFYWQSNAITCDTMAWEIFLRALFDSTDSVYKNPEGSVDFLRCRGYKAYEVTGGCALTTAILDDLHYKVIMLTQWNAVPKGEIMVNAPGMERS
ncbi:MAG: hypothetical protein PHC61_11500, partial [Chitinivibrionales bacterium]|nr:hypothetical protein [Chitinivibrionales bacterium]